MEVNGKKYIGLDTRGKHVRWREHKRGAKNGNNHLICRKMKEYGIENFEYSILFISDDREELREKERKFIKEFDTYVGHGLGYNLTLGGDDNPMFHETVRRKHRSIMKEKCSGKNHYLWGKKRSIESIRKQSLKLKGTKMGDENPAKRKEVREKISRKAKLRIGKLNPNYRHDISREDLYEYYITENKSVKEIAEHFGCSTSTIDRNLRQYNIRRPKLKINEGLLYRKYIRENKTLRECVDFFGCSNSPMKRIIRNNGWYKRDLRSEL